MNPLDPIVLDALTVGTVGAAMVMLGRRHKLLERPTERRCGACGKRIRRRVVCSCSA
jgi:hypothetical protein